MATAVQCESGDGIQRRLLETSLEHSGGTVHGSLANAQHIKNVLGRKTDQKDVLDDSKVWQQRALFRPGPEQDTFAG